MERLLCSEVTDTESHTLRFSMWSPPRSAWVRALYSQFLEYTGFLFSYLVDFATDGYGDLDVCLRATLGPAEITG